VLTVRNTCDTLVLHRWNGDEKALIRINTQAFRKLQGTLNETDFAAKLHISRPHLWRLKQGTPAGQDLITKFKDEYPKLKIEDYFVIGGE
jgi:hypothetical protein